MAKENLSINLLRDKEKPLLDRFVTWALSVGRTIVILTEIVALSAFIYRFSIDRTLADLNDDIKQKQLIVGQLTSLEKGYRNLQQRLSSAKRLTQQQDTTTKLVTDIITLATGRVRFSSLIVNQTTIKIDATTSSTSQLNYFISQLRQHPKIVRISLDKIENRTSQGAIDISLTAFLKTPTTGAKQVITQQSL
jgi:Tfp pilus assembly protein PilN